MLLKARGVTFYDMLDGQAEAAHQAAQEFRALIDDFGNLQPHIQKLNEIEHEADRLTHELANKVDATFITPLDKEDLHRLSSHLDDVTDLVEAAGVSIALYRVPELRPDLTPLVVILVEITEAMAKAVGSLRSGINRTEMHDVFVKVHEIENRGDKVFYQVMAELFNSPDADPLNVLKWKEIYDAVETAIDMCEDVANVVESIVVKYA